MTRARSKRPTDDTHLGNSFSPDLHGRRDMSIFTVDPHWRRAAQKLPSFRITEQTAESRAIENTNDLYTTPYGGRYPVIMFPEESPKPLAVAARTFAQAYYSEGLSTSACENLGKRIDCFRAAELLYLHAATRGDVRAHVGLGRMYADDCCEGHYFDAVGDDLFGEAVLTVEQITRKAHDHLTYAAAQGDAEGTYLYGDMLRDGRGCATDEKAAFECYWTSFQLIKELNAPSPTLRGDAALRLGWAYEEGCGCDEDFATALQFYHMAEADLEDAVEGGTWHYNLALSQARRGAMRVRQELDLRRRPA